MKDLKKLSKLKCVSLQVVIKHLREQQARLEVEAEAASVLRMVLIKE